MWTQVLIDRLRRRDLYKFCDEALIPAVSPGCLFSSHSRNMPQSMGLHGSAWTAMLSSHCGRACLEVPGCLLQADPQAAEPHESPCPETRNPAGGCRAGPVGPPHRGRRGELVPWLGCAHAAGGHSRPGEVGLRAGTPGPASRAEGRPPESARSRFVASPPLAPAGHRAPIPVPETPCPSHVPRRRPGSTSPCAI